MYKYVCAPGSVVGIATGYGLDGAGIESRWGVRFSAPVRTGPGAHLASCTMGIGSFPRVKSGRDVTLTLQPLLVPWSRKSRAIPLPPLPLGRTACTEPQCLYTGALFLTNTYDPSPLLVLWSRKSRAIPLPPPYEPYGLYRASVPVQGCTFPYNYL